MSWFGRNYQTPVKPPLYVTIIDDCIAKQTHPLEIFGRNKNNDSKYYDKDDFLQYFYQKQPAYKIERSWMLLAFAPITYKNIQLTIGENTFNATAEVDAGGNFELTWLTNTKKEHVGPFTLDKAEINKSFFNGAVTLKPDSDPAGFELNFLGPGAQAFYNDFNRSHELITCTNFATDLFLKIYETGVTHLDPEDYAPLIRIYDFAETFAEEACADSDGNHIRQFLSNDNLNRLERLYETKQTLQQFEKKQNGFDTDLNSLRENVDTLENRNMITTNDVIGLKAGNNHLLSTLETLENGLEKSQADTMSKFSAINEDIAKNEVTGKENKAQMDEIVTAMAERASDIGDLKQLINQTNVDMRNEVDLIQTLISKVERLHETTTNCVKAVYNGSTTAEEIKKAFDL